MSTTLAMQGGRVLLEQPHMLLGLTMAKIAKRGISLTAMEETKYLIEKPWATVREKYKWGV